MKNLINKKKVIIIVVAILVLVLTIGGAYALWTYSKTLGNQVLISGDIFLKYTEGDTINMKEAMPSLTYNPDEYFEFSVEGKNTYKKDVVFEVILDEGDQPTGDENKTRTERIKPELLKFRLVEVKTDEEGNEEEEELIQEASYDSIQKRRIWVDKVPAKTEKEIKYTYRLYMWISIDTKIGNMEGADYTAQVWNNNVFASVKVAVNGDFNPKDLTEDYMILNATNESGEPYNLKEPIQSDEDITVTLGSKREVTEFVVSKSSEYPIALMSLEEPTSYPASYNETTRAWEAKVTIDETGIYDYYAKYSNAKGNSDTYTFTVLMNPDRFVLVEKPTSALCKQGLTYTGSPQNLIDESNLNKEGYTIEQVQGTDTNSYEVKAKLNKNFRWADSSKEDATFNCTIGPKETVLTYKPENEFKVGNGLKKSFKITAPTEGTFNITSKAIETASVEFTPAVGTSTTVTVQGVEIGSTNLDINFTPSNNNYTIKTDAYNVEVFKPIATSVLKNTMEETGGIIGVPTNCIEESCTPITDRNADKSTIREYRYSGLEVNNYVYFNCKEGVEQNSDNCEIWRIIGVFKDETGQELVKIVRNEILKSAIFPETYTANGETFYIKNPDSNDWASWDKPTLGSHYNDWAEAGIMYWLNSEGTTDGYLKSLTITAQGMVDGTKWYLGNVTFYNSDYNGGDSNYYGLKDTVIEAYINERSSKSCSSTSFNGCQGGYIWPNNHATWTGKIALMYPSDYGFSTDSSYWSKKLGNATFNVSASNTSWLTKTKHTLYEWLLSPNSGGNYRVATWDSGNFLSSNGANATAGIRPSLYLNSNVTIVSGEGTELKPYEIKCDSCNG